MKYGKVINSKNPITHILNDLKKEQTIEIKGGNVSDLETKLKNITLLTTNNNNNQESKTNTKLDRFINFKL